MAGMTSETPSSPSAAAPSASDNNPSPVVVKLLLHTSDGVVPYLTPSLLEKCFPPDRFPQLRLAIAVSETCVIPVSSIASEGAKSSSLTSNDRNYATEMTTERGGVKRTKGGKGYTFSTGSISTDSWIRQYPRVTVPTLDHCRSSSSSNGSGPTLPQRQPHSNKTSGSSTTTATSLPPTTSKHVSVATDQYVMVWTPHGRLTLTPEDYVLAAQGLKSQAIIPLYDVPTPPSLYSSTNKGVSLKHVKRLETAKKRCQHWYEQCCQSDSIRQHGSSVCVPFVVDPNGTNLDNINPIAGENDDNPMVASKVSSTESSSSLSNGPVTDSATGVGASESGPSSVHEAGHVVVLGWHHVPDAPTRRSILTSVAAKQQRLQSSSTHPLDVCVLVIESLRQFLDAAGSLCTSSCDIASTATTTTNLLLGTDLPQKWARTHKAFVLDLTTTSASSESSIWLLPTKRPRLMQETLPVLDGNGCIDLTPTDPPKVHPWFRDNKPLVLGCPCLACTSHSRSYLYHLVCAKELLVEMMLFVHNLHHLLSLVTLVNDQVYNSEEIGGRIAIWDQLERHWMAQINDNDGSKDDIS